MAKPSPLKCITKWCRGKRGSKSNKCCKCQMRIWRVNNPIKASYSTLRHNAKRRKVEFKLTLKQWTKLLSKFPDYIDRRGCLLPQHLQIDRIERKKGYTYKNIQVLTFEQNRRKEYFELSLDKTRKQ